jgi:hypothetical protein
MSATKKDWSIKNIRVASVLFVLIALDLLFPFATSSQAITITGTETITTNSNTTYTAADCSGTVSWSVTGTGASISSNGVLTAGSASCGGITVTAHCSDGSIATKTARVTNAGQWVQTSSCGPVPCNAFVASLITGKYYYTMWYNAGYQTSCNDDFNTACCNASGNCPLLFAIPGLPSGGTPPVVLCCVFQSTTSEWQCPSCTNGQAIPCYTGTGGTQGVGVCKAGTQTCVNGQWGACVGEILPTTEICGNDKDENCDGNIDEGCGCGYTIPNLPSKIIGQCDPAWKSNPRYDLTSSSICSQGCAMASLTMLMNQQGCNVDMLRVNSCSQCFGTSGAVDWSKVLNIFCSNVKYRATESKNVASYRKPHIPIPESLISEVNEGLKRGDLYLLKVGSPNSPNGYRQHFVFVIGTTADCKGLRVYDPATGEEKVYYYYKGFRKFKGM